MRLPRVASHRGFIFASLSAEGVTFEEFLGPAVKYLDASPTRRPKRDRGKSPAAPADYASNWKLQIENFADFYHPSFTHEKRDGRTRRHNSAIARGCWQSHRVQERPYGRRAVRGRWQRRIIRTSPTNGYGGAKTVAYAEALEASRGAERARGS